MQLEDGVDFFYMLFDKSQYLLIKLDNSQAHKYQSEDVFILGNFNYGPGGSILKVQNIIAAADLIRLHVHPKVAKDRDEIMHVFADEDDPPKDKEEIPKYDTLRQ